MLLNKEDIFSFILQHKDELAKKYHVQKIGVFGSFARDEQKENSDIDLIVEFSTQADRLHETKEALRDQFKAKFHREVDIANAKYLKPYIREDILKEAKYAR
ncbi:MAG: nucleotidyltransferase family protein [Candidatus Margulisiibacteriota bacterium]|jgi:hypothetical protein